MYGPAEYFLITPLQISNIPCYRRKYSLSKLPTEALNRCIRMGNFKKESARKQRQSKPPGMGNIKTKGENFYRYARPPNLYAF